MSRELTTVLKKMLLSVFCIYVTPLSWSGHMHDHTVLSLAMTSSQRLVYRVSPMDINTTLY